MSVRRQSNSVPYEGSKLITSSLNVLYGPIIAPLFNVAFAQSWTPFEDDELREKVAIYGEHAWTVIASHFPNRVAKQCRERYINHLKPGIKKGRLSPDECKLVAELRVQYGNKWSEIAKYLPSRTPNQIKNYWHSLRKSDRDEMPGPPSGTSTPMSASHKRRRDYEEDSISLLSSEEDYGYGRDRSGRAMPKRGRGSGRRGRPRGRRADYDSSDEYVAEELGEPEPEDVQPAPQPPVDPDAIPSFLLPQHQLQMLASTGLPLESFGIPLADLESAASSLLAGSAQGQVLPLQAQLLNYHALLAQQQAVLAASLPAATQEGADTAAPDGVAGTAAPAADADSALQPDANAAAAALLQDPTGQLLLPYLYMQSFPYYRHIYSQSNPALASGTDANGSALSAESLAAAAAQGSVPPEFYLNLLSPALSPLSTSPPPSVLSSTDLLDPTGQALSLLDPAFAAAFSLGQIAAPGADAGSAMPAGAAAGDAQPQDAMAVDTAPAVADAHGEAAPSTETAPSGDVPADNGAGPASLPDNAVPVSLEEKQVAPDEAIKS